MSITSPLAALYSVLQTVRSSAEANATLLRKNEAATRAALIDPILRALGWDTANVQMVEPEKTINTAWRADYALHDSTGKITSLVEAKCLGADLEKYSVVQQLLSYSFGFGVQRIVITDGLNWHFYSEFKPGNSHSTANIHLLKNDIINCALLLVEWLDAAQSGHGIEHQCNLSDNSISVSLTHNSSESVLDNLSTTEVPQSTESTKDPILSNTLTMAVQLGKTYYNRGFFNVGTKHKHLFGDKEGTITIKLGLNTDKVIQGNINRKDNLDGRPRIAAGKRLAKWLQENFELEDTMQVDIISPSLVCLHK